MRREWNPAGQRAEAPCAQVAVVLSGLIGAAKKDLVEFLAKAGMTAHELANREGGKIVGAEASECAAEAADRRADVVADERFFGHGRTIAQPGP